jgi:hypothetical protein
MGVRKTESASAYAPGILALSGWGTPSTLAANFAKAGGTAWQHHNGLWVSIVDDKARLISNYRPSTFVSIVRPVWPLRLLPGGGYVVTDKFSR